MTIAGAAARSSAARADRCQRGQVEGLDHDGFAPGRCRRWPRRRACPFVSRTGRQPTRRARRGPGRSIPGRCSRRRDHGQRPVLAGHLLAGPLRLHDPPDPSLPMTYDWLDSRLDVIHSQGRIGSMPRRPDDAPDDPRRRRPVPRRSYHATTFQTSSATTSTPRESTSCPLPWPARNSPAKPSPGPATRSKRSSAKPPATPMTRLADPRDGQILAAGLGIGLPERLRHRRHGPQARPARRGVQRRLRRRARGGGRRWCALRTAGHRPTAPRPSPT